MNPYERFVLPHLVHLRCGRESTRLQRRKVVPLASGEVVELGFGSGLNLPYYDPGAVTRLWALEPSEPSWRIARAAVAKAPFRVEFVNAPAEEIPLPDASIDTVLVTYTLCTLPEVSRAMREARRVLKPGGRLVFCEHGEAPDESIRRWQVRLDPYWSRIAGGCEMGRAIPSLIEAGGFRIERLSKAYIEGWKPLSFNYWGIAVPRA